MQTYFGFWYGFNNSRITTDPNNVFGFNSRVDQDLIIKFCIDRCVCLTLSKVRLVWPMLFHVESIWTQSKSVYENTCWNSYKHQPCLSTGKHCPSPIKASVVYKMWTMLVNYRCCNNPSEDFECEVSIKF